MSTRRPAEQEHFGSALPGDAQADSPRRDPEMVNDDAGESAAPEVVVRDFFEAVFNDGDLDAIERFIAPDHINHDPTAPEVPPGPNGVRTLAQYCRGAFPDIEYSIEEIFSSEDRVAHRWRFTGTHEGDLMGIEPTGRRVEVMGIEINRLDRGKIADSWAISDADGLRKQLEE
jgi:steroid delta-isomerase-like uncharacterized protein